MNRLIGMAFLAVGMLNLYPIVGMTGASRLASLYGIAVDSPDVELLMRHRALLLGLVGSLLVVAAWRPALRGTAALVGVISMAGFVALAWPVGAHGPAIARVFWADVAGIVVLAGAYGLAAILQQTAPQGMR